MQPRAHVTALQYRDQFDGAQYVDTFRVYFQAPDGDEYYHTLPNGGWSVNNPTLQFLAKWGWRPTELHGTITHVRDDQVLVPVVPSGSPTDPDYDLAQTALDGGVSALEEAEWFTPRDGEDDDSDGAGGPHGGGSPDPGTGNRGGVEEPSEVEP